MTTSLYENLMMLKMPMSVECRWFCRWQEVQRFVERSSHDAHSCSSSKRGKMPIGFLEEARQLNKMGQLSYQYIYNTEKDYYWYHEDDNVKDNQDRRKIRISMKRLLTVEKCNIKRYHAIPVLQKAIFINRQIYKSTRNTSKLGFNFSIFSRVLWKNSII